MYDNFQLIISLAKKSSSRAAVVCSTFLKFFFFKKPFELHHQRMKFLLSKYKYDKKNSSSLLDNAPN